MWKQRQIWLQGKLWLFTSGEVFKSFSQNRFETILVRETNVYEPLQCVYGLWDSWQENVIDRKQKERKEPKATICRLINTKGFP